MAKTMRVSFILDETGSMQTVKEATISGFNEYIDTLAKDKASENVLFTLTKFNANKIDIVLNNVEISKVPHLTGETYRPTDLTPLYDAIGKTINSLGGLKGKKQHVLVVIQTDGLENASKEYDRKKIFDMINEKKDKGWAFIFLGADQDAYIVSESIGVSRGNTMSYNSQDTQKTLRGMADATVCYASAGGMRTTNLVSDEDDDSK